MIKSSIWRIWISFDSDGELEVSQRRKSRFLSDTALPPTISRIFFFMPFSFREKKTVFQDILLNFRNDQAGDGLTASDSFPDFSA